MLSNISDAVRVRQRSSEDPLAEHSLQRPSAPVLQGSLSDPGATCRHLRPGDPMRRHGQACGSRSSAFGRADLTTPCVC